MAHKSTRRRQRRWLLLVLLLVAAATASLALLDKRPPMSPEPVPPPRDLYASDVCSEAEREAIAETREEARRAHVLIGCEQGP